MLYEIIAIFWAFSIFLLYKHFCNKKKLPPGPFSFPFIGYAFQIDSKAPFKTFDRLRNEYGKIFRLQVGRVEIVALSDHKLIRTAFAKSTYTGRPPLMITHGIMKGYGIIGAEGSRWQQQRKFVTDAFRVLGATRHSHSLQKLEAKIQDEAKLFVSVLEELADGRPFDCHEVVSVAFVNVICRLLFDERYGYKDEKILKQLRMVDEGVKTVDIMGALNFFPVLRYLPKFRSAYEGILDSQKEHHEFLKQHVNHHRKTVDVQNPRDFLDLFIIEQDENRKTLCVTKDETNQLIFTLADLFGAGSETTKSTFLWLLIYVMLNYDVQEKVQREVDNKIGAEKLPDYSDLAKLPYTEAVLLETQRLSSIVPFGAPHGTTQDSELEGYFIEKGTMIVPLMWSVHMDPDVYPEPEEFKPSRFLENEGGDQEVVFRPDQFLPFSAGRRMCPGEDLAKIELFILFVAVMQKFLVLPPENETPDLTPQMGFTLSPLPFKMRLVPRQPQIL